MMKYSVFLRDFNPRSREGSDPARCACSLPAKISIHAPARGATFNWYIFNYLWLFQSTLPRGERRNRTGCAAVSSGISIHAPARGATVGGVILLWHAFISIHAPARGATNPVFPKTSGSYDFNPRSREGSDGGLYKA